jgi:hypothetical protein
MRFSRFEQLRNLIDLRIEESSSLEYKSELSLQGRTARRELLKDLTGMGNGGGGSIVFGIAEERENSAAESFSPLPSRSVIGQVESIVQDAVRPPLIWSHQSFSHRDGVILVIDVERSPLGPYMVDAYDDQRYYVRSGKHVTAMTESMVRDSYAIALRNSEHRDALWARHLLPMKGTGDQPWLTISALPEEPLTEIFDSRTVDLRQLQAPEVLARYQSHTGLQFATGRMRHWADGLTCDDRVNGQPPSTAIRLHRDGAAGIALLLRTELNTDWILRLVNAYLLYLGSFWQGHSLQRPVEIEIGISGLKTASVPRNAYGVASVEIVEPVGVTIDSVSVQGYELPWELMRAPKRHHLLHRLADRLEQSFGRGGAASLFERGWLYGRGGSPLEYGLDRGLIYRPNQGRRVAQLDQRGRVHSGDPDVVLWVDNGAVVDHEGKTVAVLEMATSASCPDDFVPDVRLLRDTPNATPIDPLDASSFDSSPQPSGEWSDFNLVDLLH